MGKITENQRVVLNIMFDCDREAERCIRDLEEYMERLRNKERLAEAER